MKQGGYTHKRPFYWYIGTTFNLDGDNGINRHCTDLSKTHVERCFEAAFGYGSFVDPNGIGKAVIKSEVNAVHDGRVVDLPYQLKDGEICQRLIDTGGSEWRVVIVWGEVACVMLKEKSGTFSTGAKKFNTFPAELFPPDLRQMIKLFCANLEMDYGELDILQDQNDDRIYIVDANQCPGGGTKEFFDQSKDELDLFVKSHAPLFE